MKCPYCGASVRRGSSVCEYCDSDLSADTNVNINIHNHYASPPARRRGGGKTILTVIVVLIVISFVIPVAVGAVLAISMLRSGIGDYQSERELRISDLSDETVTVQEYSGGTVSFTYLSDRYNNVKILDKELTDWLAEEDKSLKGAEILFSTDKDGNIKKLAMRSAPFVVIAEENGKYTACRDEQVFEFTSYKQLDTGIIYDGYFSYSDVYLAKADEAAAFIGALYDPRCGGKETKTVQDAYTGKELTLYRIRCNGMWYYCPRDIYDSVEENDTLDGYRFLDTPPCVLIE